MRAFVLTAVLAATPACVKAAPEKTSERRAEQEPSPAPAAPPASVAAAASALTAEPSFAATISERFAQEAANRPQGTPRAEDVWTAFEKAGVKVDAKQQHAAKPYGASYCAGAKAEPDLHMSVCEHPDEAAATTGRDVSRKMFESVPNREVHLHKKTTLTIRQGTRNAESEARAKKMVELFRKL